VFAAITVTGCSACRHYTGQRSSAKTAQAVLASARANEISLFGDLPGASESVFISRSAVPLRRHSFTEVGADYDADIDAEGERIVFASTRHSLRPDLYIKSVDGVAVTQLTSDAASDVQPTFSPDGSRVAFASNRAGQWDIWTIDVDGGPPVQITSSPAEEIHPSWSPDGQQLVYCTLPASGGQWELWVTSAYAGGTKRFVGFGLFPEWSPVENRIVFQRARERGSRWFGIWTITLIGGEPKHPTELASSSTESMILPTWSPDGARIAFASASIFPSECDELRLPTSTGVFDVWVMGADGRGRTRLTDGLTFNYAPTFAPSGRVFFSSSRSGQENIWSLGLAGVTGVMRDDHRISRVREHTANQPMTAKTVASQD
jgi:Tol biopolymer transport system component